MFSEHEKDHLTKLKLYFRCKTVARWKFYFVYFLLRMQIPSFMHSDLDKFSRNTFSWFSLLLSLHSVGVSKIMGTWCFDVKIYF